MSFRFGLGRVTYCEANFFARALHLTGRIQVLNASWAFLRVVKYCNIAQQAAEKASLIDNYILGLICKL